jgi:DNA repair protein RadC
MEYENDKPIFKSIKEWREDDRPREKLKMHGANTLSDAELLAILIRTGTKGYSAIDAAKDLLESHENLTNLASCDLSEFRRIKGLGETKAITLAATFEIGKRIETGPVNKFNKVSQPEDIAKIYIPKYRGARTEIFKVLLLNTANKIFREVNVTEGILNASIVHPREVFRLAITESAASIILMHNHPSGNPDPSEEDRKITRQMIEASKIIEIKVLDHIIIAGDTFTSFAKEGLM